MAVDAQRLRELLERVADPAHPEHEEAVRSLLEIGFDVGAETERNKAWERLVKRAGELERDEPDIANVLKAAAAMLDAREHLAGDENPFRAKKQGESS